jgi:hypothetical protein
VLSRTESLHMCRLPRMDCFRAVAASALHHFLGKSPEQPGSVSSRVLMCAKQRAQALGEANPADSRVKSGL